MLIQLSNYIYIYIQHCRITHRKNGFFVPKKHACARKHGYIYLYMQNLHIPVPCTKNRTIFRHPVLIYIYMHNDSLKHYFYRIPQLPNAFVGIFALFYFPPFYLFTRRVYLRSVEPTTPFIDSMKGVEKKKQKKKREVKLQYKRAKVIAKQYKDWKEVQKKFSVNGIPPPSLPSFFFFLFVCACDETVSHSFCEGSSSHKKILDDFEEKKKRHAHTSTLEKRENKERGILRVTWPAKRTSELHL